MLVLTRRLGEKILIGDPANPIGVVQVVELRGDRVRLGFEFPNGLQVHREEVAEQILAKRAEAQAKADAAGLTEPKED